MTETDVSRRVRENGKDGRSLEELMGIYSKWAPNYDQDLLSGGYKGPALTAEYLHKQNLPKDSRILDVAAGTGLNANILRSRYKFHNIDALDACQEMLDEARKQGLYKEYFCCPIGDGHTVPIPDNTYDAAVMSGGLAGGHIKLDAFDEMIRITKPGGYIVNTMREEHRRLVKEYQQMDEVLSAKEGQGMWRKVLQVTTERGWQDTDSITHVYRVTKSL